MAGSRHRGAGSREPPAPTPHPAATCCKPSGSPGRAALRRRRARHLPPSPGARAPAGTLPAPPGPLPTSGLRQPPRRCPVILEARRRRGGDDGGSGGSGGGGGAGARGGGAALAPSPATPRHASPRPAAGEARSPGVLRVLTPARGESRQPRTPQRRDPRAPGYPRTSLNAFLPSGGRYMPLRLRCGWVPRQRVPQRVWFSAGRYG